jgi:hypothetical protein
MTRHAKKSDHLQLVDVPKTAIVEVPLSLLGALANTEYHFWFMGFAIWPGRAGVPR